MNDAVEQLIADMNNIPEKAGLSQPRLVDEMKWNEAQGILDTKTWRLANAIKRHCRLLRPASLRQQVYMLMKLLKESEMLEADCIVGFVSRLLDKPEPQVRAMYANFDEFTKGEVGQAQGRPKLLTENQIAEVVAKVRSMVVAKRPMTRRDVVSFIYEQFKIKVSKQWVKRLVNDNDELCQAIAVPMERARAEVTHAQLDAFYNEFTEQTKGVHPQLVFNMDEVGFSRKVRCPSFPCIVTSEYSGMKVEAIPQESYDTTFTLVACVNLAGGWLPPLVVIPRKTLPWEFLGEYVWAQHDCYFEFNASGFANGDIIAVWYENVFLPRLEEMRATLQLGKAPAVLLCDGFRGHATEWLKGRAALDNVRLVFLPAHSSHVTQPLDQFVFANIKQAYGASRSAQSETLSDHDRTSRKVKKILMAFYRSVDPFTVRDSWDRVGIRARWKPDGGLIGIEVTREKVIGQHVEMPLVEACTESEGHRRVAVSDPLVNRHQLVLVEGGVCPLCGKTLEPPSRGNSRRVRFVVHEITPKRIRLTMGEPS